MPWHIEERPRSILVAPTSSPDRAAEDPSGRVMRAGGAGTRGGQRTVVPSPLLWAIEPGGTTMTRRWFDILFPFVRRFRAKAGALR